MNTACADEWNLVEKACEHRLGSRKLKWKVNMQMNMQMNIQLNWWKLARTDEWTQLVQMNGILWTQLARTDVSQHGQLARAILQLANRFSPHCVIIWILWDFKKSHSMRNRLNKQKTHVNANQYYYAFRIRMFFCSKDVLWNLIIWILWDFKKSHSMAKTTLQLANRFSPHCHHIMIDWVVCETRTNVLLF